MFYPFNAVFFGDLKMKYQNRKEVKAAIIAYIDGLHVWEMPVELRDVILYHLDAAFEADDYRGLYWAEISNEAAEAQIPTSYSDIVELWLKLGMPEPRDYGWEYTNIFDGMRDGCYLALNDEYTSFLDGEVRSFVDDTLAEAYVLDA
jgi:hypothetical protein